MTGGALLAVRPSRAGGLSSLEQFRDDCARPGQLRGVPADSRRDRHAPSEELCVALGEAAPPAVLRNLADPATVDVDVDVDVVCLVVPNVPHAREALSMGLHVVVEKHLALSGDESREPLRVRVS